MTSQKMDWGQELHQTVVKSLATSFGLDFLLFKDQDGGDVNTIHNVRAGVYATKKERQNYENRGVYNSDVYHKDDRYKEVNRQGKAQREAGELSDTYTGEKFKPGEKMNLDHIISANEIHHDPGRVLAGIQGNDLANDSSNLTFTGETINKSKQALPMPDYVKKLRDNYQASQGEIAVLKNKPSLTEKEQKHLNKLENKAKADFDLMLEADEKARARYNGTVDATYYTSSKFAKNVASASLLTGLKMGARQMLGLILAEVWFEVHERIPSIYTRLSEKFSAREFLSDIGDALTAAWERIKVKFHDFLISFKDGAIGGLLSSLTTTLFNIVFTTKKTMVRLIREMWNNLVQAFKIIVFNPQNLLPGQLVKEVCRVLSAGIAVVTGVLLNQHLAGIFLFPFGPELAAFCSAVVTGVLTLTMNYFLENSAMMQKLWAFLDKFKDKFQKAVEYYQHVNAELDRYIVELSQLEFSMNTDELLAFSSHLLGVNDEVERGFILQAEVEKRAITLPYQGGNISSARSWLSSL